MHGPRLRFGDYTLDVAARRLLRGAAPVHLSPKAFDALAALIDSRPRAVSKSELLERVWCDVVVSETSLTRTVNEIRTALRDLAREPQFIRTVHGYGYAFAADVRDESDVAGAFALPIASLISATRSVVLRPGEHLVGRDPTSEVWIDSPHVSWRHARLVVTSASVMIEDLDSKNGTYVRGVRIATPVTLEGGDEVRIGRVKFAFRTSETQLTETDAEG